MLEQFAAFPEIQVIDLDAALGRGSNDAIVEFLAARARTRVGGGVRTAERAPRVARSGRAPRHRRHGGVFGSDGVNVAAA